LIAYPREYDPNLTDAARVIKDLEDTDRDEASRKFAIETIDQVLETPDVVTTPLQ
jgi:hypothetical protein